jgi:hypothetical protein
VVHTITPATQEVQIRIMGCRWKPARADSSREPIAKKNHHKNRAGGVAQGVGPKFKRKKEKKPNTKQSWWSGSSG